MINARNGIISELENNDQLYRNKEGSTVALLLASKGIIPPR